MACLLAFLETVASLCYPARVYDNASPMSLFEGNCITVHVAPAYRSQVAYNIVYSPTMDE